MKFLKLLALLPAMAIGSVVHAEPKPFVFVGECDSRDYFGNETSVPFSLSRENPRFSRIFSLKDGNGKLTDHAVSFHILGREEGGDILFFRGGRITGVQGGTTFELFGDFLQEIAGQRYIRCIGNVSAK